METVGEEILREILVKLPTRDIARSSCVSRLWRLVVGDPSFRSLHGKAAHIVSGSGSGAAESLLITETRNDFVGLKMVIGKSSSAKPLCRITDLARAYGPANVCNGLILFASFEDWPVVCNPITGQKLDIPPPPEIESWDEHTYAMGFSPSTGQYKLFVLLFNGILDSYMGVYTLGGGAGWRRHPYKFSATCSTHSPVLIDGKLYVVTECPRELPDRRILVIDVASEAHCMYLLPCLKVENTVVHAFDLYGRLCIAERFLEDRRLYFWAMPPLQGPRLMDDKNCAKLELELLYCFYVDKDIGNGRIDLPRGVWLDNDDRMLCYRQGGSIYKYNTTTENKEAPGSFSEWDSRILLPETSSSSNDEHDDRRWSIYGGYHPSLLSPRLVFPSLPQYRDKQEDLERLVHAIRCKGSSNKEFSACPPNCAGDKRGVKRIRETQSVIREHKI